MDRTNRQEISPAYGPWESVNRDVILTDFGDMGPLGNVKGDRLHRQNITKQLQTKNVIDVIPTDCYTKIWERFQRGRFV